MTAFPLVVLGVSACVQTATPSVTDASTPHTGALAETSPPTHSATWPPTGCDGYRVTGYLNGTTISGTTTNTFCWDEEPEGLQNGCRVAFESDPCPAFDELVAALDWFAPSEDVRMELYRCVRGDGIDLDVVEWFDTSRGMRVDARFFAADGLVEAIRAYIVDYSPGQQFCCRGHGTGHAGWDPHRGIGATDCVERIPYGPDDFQ